MSGIRPDRVKAMADWLDTIPPDPPFHAHPDFHRFADLTSAEMEGVAAELRERAIDAQAEADELRRFKAERRRRS